MKVVNFELDTYAMSWNFGARADFYPSVRGPLKFGTHHQIWNSNCSNVLKASKSYSLLVLKIFGF